MRLLILSLVLANAALNYASASMPRYFSFRLERIRWKGRRTARSHPTFGA
jgi:hypothetical protein